MRNFYLLTAVLCVLLCSGNARAQLRTITIEELFELCDNSSKSVEISRLGAKMAAEGVKVARSAMLPEVESSLSVSFLGDGCVTDRDFTNFTNADMPHFGNNFAIKASQVIYAGGAISAGIKQAEIDKKIAEKGVELQKQNIRFLMLGNYLELCKLSNRAVIFKKNIEQTELLVSHIKAKHNAGTALRNDITRYELRLEQLRLGLHETENNMRKVNYHIVQALGLPDETIIAPDSAITNYRLQVLSRDQWQSEAESNSPILHIAQLKISKQQQKEHSVKAERLPQVALVAANHLDGPITIEVPTIDKNFNYWYVGVGLKYNISALWKANKKSRIERIGTICAKESAELAREETGIAINSAFIALENAYEQLHTQEKSVELARENYNVVNNRYLNDLALVTDMIDASNALIETQLQLVNARINVIYSTYNLQRVAGTL
ncbi:MAG: TolC family protein [Bacteroidaceae bacterium]|nr:TolC family protein [Bacteroidaceae bacterium]